MAKNNLKQWSNLLKAHTIQHLKLCKQCTGSYTKKENGKLIWHFVPYVCVYAILLCSYVEAI